MPADKKGIFNISAQTEETDIAINSNRDWEISYKTEDSLVQERLKGNSYFWKNELKPSLFVQNIIDNGYISFLLPLPHCFTFKTTNPA